MAVPKKLKQSQRQEQRVAVANGGKVTPGSGATFVSKGDVRSNRFLIECKRTNNTRSISVQLEAMDKIEMEAAIASKLPVMALEIGRRQYYLVPDFVWEEVTNA